MKKTETRRSAESKCPECGGPLNALGLCENWREPAPFRGVASRATVATPAPAPSPTPIPHGRRQEDVSEANQRRSVTNASEPRNQK